MRRSGREEREPRGAAGLHQPRWRWAALAVVALVPLAFAGLFAGALSSADDGTARIPAAVVNGDAMVYSVAADGSETPVFAGRQLVTELTAGASGFDWSVTNAADARAGLKDGTFSAVLTIPEDFSASILSLSSDSPRRAQLAIATDDAHDYLSGAVAQLVGRSMTDAFGKAITAQYISGLYSGLGELGGSIGDAADGAARLSEGVSEYTRGADRLSEGLSALDRGAAGLGRIGEGVSGYADGVSRLSAALSQSNAALQADPTNPQALASLAAIAAQLDALAGQGSALGSSTASALAGVQDGISRSASGAAELAAGSAALRSGAAELASGLEAGAEQLPAADGGTSEAAGIAADPVQLTVTRHNEVNGVGQLVATFFVPLGLWVGALAVFLVLRPLSRRALESSARNGRLVGLALARAGIVALAQAVLLVALLHLALGAPWTALPATLGFSALMALAFTAFHGLLAIGLGRPGLVVSLLLVALQVTAAGGLYPLQLLAEPFPWLSTFLPLSYGVSGMQTILAGGSPWTAVGAAAVLLAFGAGSALATLLALRRRRRAHALGLVPALR